MVNRFVLLSFLLGYFACGFASPDSKEESQGTPLLDSSVEIPALNMAAIEEAFYFVKGSDGSGSAFLLEDKDGVWLISNSHVFQHARSPKITNIKRDELALPKIIEVAPDRDLIRFRVDRPHGLTSASSCNYNQSVFAFGNSGGAGVLSVLGGRVIAMGSDRFEISAKIIPGNSGGPIVDRNSQVIGVSSYLLNHTNMPSWMIKDTPFKETRRMALRLQDIKWVPMNFSAYQEESLIMNQVEENMRAFIKIAESLSTNISKPITCTIDNEDLQNWLRRHNRLTDRIREPYASRDSLYQNSKRNLKGLIEVIATLEDDAGNLYQVKNPYFISQMKTYSIMYRTIREHMEASYSGLN